MHVYGPTKAALSLLHKVARDILQFPDITAQKALMSSVRSTDLTTNIQQVSCLQKRRLKQSTCHRLLFCVRAPNQCGKMYVNARRPCFQGKEDFDNIPQRVETETAASRANVEAKMNNFLTDINAGLGDITRLADDVSETPQLRSPPFVGIRRKLNCYPVHTFGKTQKELSSRLVLRSCSTLVIS